MSTAISLGYGTLLSDALASAVSNRTRRLKGLATFGVRSIMIKALTCYAYVYLGLAIISILSSNGLENPLSLACSAPSAARARWTRSRRGRSWRYAPAAWACATATEVHSPLTCVSLNGLVCCFLERGLSSFSFFFGGWGFVDVFHLDSYIFAMPRVLALSQRAKTTTSRSTPVNARRNCRCNKLQLHCLPM